MRGALGLALGVVARAWLATLRLRVELDPALDPGDARPWILSFFHGTQWPLLAWRRRRATVVMVSLSADGAMQARALSVLGLSVVRGSSSRGGARGLAALVRRVRAGLDAAFAVDGPRGPYGEVKPGALLAARATGGVLVPMGSAASRGHVFSGAWDRFVLAWPFSRVAVVLGAPLDASSGPDRLRDAVAAANARARAVLGLPAGPAAYLGGSGGARDTMTSLNVSGRGPVQPVGSAFARSLGPAGARGDGGTAPRGEEDHA